MDSKGTKKITERLYKDRPLSGISLNEFERPTNDYNTNIRRLCISLGLVRPGESRIAIVYILDILLKARKKRPNGMDSYEIIKELYKKKVRIVYANILRDLRKLISVGIVERRNSFYRVRENMKLDEIMTSFVKPYIIDRTLSKIEEYAKAVEKGN
jgi:Fe2+ or Zn2+ uptake regulation protein